MTPWPLAREMIARYWILACRGKLFLFKTDAVVEGTHFTGETPPEKIGRKALARCLSDVAAMAGTPGAALVTIGTAEKIRCGVCPKNL